MKEEHGAEEERVGKEWLPVLELTLELRSSRRFPALILRNLIDGDRSRFLIRLVMVDPSTAIMMRRLGDSFWPSLGTCLTSGTVFPLHRSFQYALLLT